MTDIDHIGVHATHCCKVHGCKYGDHDCPVVLGIVDGLFECEDCSYDRERYTELLSDPDSLAFFKKVLREYEKEHGPVF